MSVCRAFFFSSDSSSSFVTFVFHTFHLQASGLMDLLQKISTCQCVVLSLVRDRGFSSSLDVSIGNFMSLVIVPLKKPCYNYVLDV